MKPAGFALKKIVLSALVLVLLLGTSVGFADPSGPGTKDGGFASPIPFAPMIFGLL